MIVYPLCLFYDFFDAVPFLTEISKSTTKKKAQGVYIKHMRTENANLKMFRQSSGMFLLCYKCAANGSEITLVQFIYF